MAALVAGVLGCGMSSGWAAAQTVQRETVTVAILPSQTSVDDLDQINGMAVGLMSTGIGQVPAEQTYLDISQGNRVNDALYDRDLPPLPAFTNWVPGWQRIVARATSAPADIQPGLLAGHLGGRAVADPSLRDAALIAANRPGFLKRRFAGPCAPPCHTFRVAPMSATTVRRLVRDLSPPDLLVALVAPSQEVGLTPIGIAGQGFHGELTSDSTRTDGYVLSTDIAPTILRRFGLAIPGEMDGEPINAVRRRNVQGLEDLADRMEVIPDRRAPVVIISLLAWMLIAGLVALAVPGLRRNALAWLALAFAYMPVMLLAGAAIEPSAVAEGLLVGVGAALLAALTLAVARGWWALAIACAITVVAYAVDVIAGSGLTKLSLLGPNPIYGARFYGMGNELEALFAVMMPVGAGAGLSAWRRSGKPLTERGAALAFVVSGLLAAIVFAAGRFGADVGAAIVLPVGALVAAVSLWTSDFVDLPGYRPGKSTKLARPLLLLAIAIVCLIFIALIFLVLIDLVTGANSHLTRSVLDAGGASDLADVAQRRLELSAHDFAQAARNPLFWVVIVGLVAAIAQWRRIDAWLRPAPIARAGLIGACAAVVAGVLVNDSGATFLVLGALALGAFLAFAWAQTGEIRSSPRNTSGTRG